MGVTKVFLLLLALLVSSQAAKLEWWRTASFYQIYPRSFKDSDGDGVGDLKGITQELPYLKEIGTTAAWLSPIFTSPMADFGYDVANLTEVDPIFGTMADFDDLLAKAKKIGVKIILDFVPNHTSDECEWFQKSAANDSYYRDFYVWHGGKIVNGVRQPPTNWISVFRGSMWTWHEQRHAYYLHQFHHKQPDLNYRNPVVVETTKNVLRFWLRKGVSGFRVDAVPHNFEVAADSEGNYPDEPRNPNVNDPEDFEYLQHIYTKNQPETIDLIYQFRETLDEIRTELGEKDEFILMNEAYTSLDIIMQYYGNATHEGAQIPFNFELITNIKQHSNAYDYEKYIYKWLNNMPHGRTANWVMGNHDNSRIATRLGKTKIDIINMLLMTLPGCSVTYQGEEIGMENVWISWEDTMDPQACQSNPSNYERLTRDPVRTPFQWNDEPFAGFTNGSSTWLPVAENYKTVNVKREQGIARSTLNIYKKVKSLRSLPTFKRGAVEVKALNERVLAVKRFLRYNPTYVVLLNMGNNVENFDLRQELQGLSSKLRYVVVNSKSIRHEGSTVRTNSVLLLPNEAAILKTV